jgi:hypothetical protein
MTTINIYPETPKPTWMKEGAFCFCLGEAWDILKVDQVLDKAAVMSTGGFAHGTESFSKLYQTMAELEVRRPELASPLSAKEREDQTRNDQMRMVMLEKCARYSPEIKLVLREEIECHQCEGKKTYCVICHNTGQITLGDGAHNCPAAYDDNELVFYTGQCGDKCENCDGKGTILAE